MPEDIPTKEPELTVRQTDTTSPAQASSQRVEQLENLLTNVQGRLNAISPERAEEIRSELRKKYPDYEYMPIPSWMVSENPKPPEPIPLPEYLLKRGEKEPWEMTSEEFENEAPLFHGTTKDFKGPPKVVSTVGTSHLGVFASTSKEVARIHTYGVEKGGRIIPLAIKPDARLIRQQDIPSHIGTGMPGLQWLKDNGYDGELDEPVQSRKDEGTVVVGITDDIFMDHATIVRNALKNGKPVPQTVKKEYQKSLASNISKTFKSLRAFTKR